jgi:uncharacterized protein YggE
MRSTLWLAVVLTFSACGAPRAAVTTPEGEAHGIVVTGRGEVDVPPDVAVVSIGVDVRRPTVAEAREVAARAQTGVIEALRRAGVGDADVRTTELAIQPDYEHTPVGRRLLGYTARNVVEARVRDLDRVQRAIDDAVAAGGDETRLDGLRFELDDPAAARRRARAEAIEAARADAEQIASSLGVRLGEPIAVEEVGGGGPQPMMMARMEAAQPAAETPIEPGSTRVTVEVRVRWAMDAS